MLKLIARVRKFSMILCDEWQRELINWLAAILRDALKDIMVQHLPRLYLMHTAKRGGQLRELTEKGINSSSRCVHECSNARTCSTECRAAN